MRKHVVIWSVVAVVLAGAVVVTVARRAQAPANALESAPEAAVAEALAALEMDPAAWQRSTQAALRAAAVYVEQGRVRTAEGYYVLAVQYQREQNLSGAEALYKRAIALAPDWSRPYDGLGNLLGRHSIGRMQEAKEALRKAIALAPDWSRPHNSLAVILRIEGKYAQAEAEALTALRLAPQDIGAHNNYANLLVTLDRYEEAKEHYRVAIQLEPKHPKPYYNLACLFALQGRNDEALANLQEAIKREPLLRRNAADDEDLDPLHDDPRFARMVMGEETGATHRIDANDS